MSDLTIAIVFGIIVGSFIAAFLAFGAAIASWLMDRFTDDS